MGKIAPAFQNLELWTIQKIKVLKGMLSNYLVLIIDQNSNILLIYKGLYSTHGIIFDCLHILLLFNAILLRKK